MPPKPKHTKEEIISAAVELVREMGLSALTSRNLGARLGTTARPIFTAFSGMDELYAEVQKTALLRFDEYGKSTAALSGFERIGFMIVSFATDEPNLFKVLFLESSKSLHSVEAHIDRGRSMVEVCFGDIMEEYSLTASEAQFLFDQFRIYTFGISTLCEMGEYHFSREEIIRRLNCQVDATLKLINNSKN